MTGSITTRTHRESTPGGLSLEIKHTQMEGCSIRSCVLPCEDRDMIFQYQRLLTLSCGVILLCDALLSRTTVRLLQHVSAESARSLAAGSCEAEQPLRARLGAIATIWDQHTDTRVHFLFSSSTQQCRRLPDQPPRFLHPRLLLAQGAREPPAPG